MLFLPQCGLRARPRLSVHHGGAHVRRCAGAPSLVAGEKESRVSLHSPSNDLLPTRRGALVTGASVPSVRFDNMRDFTTTRLEGFDRALRADTLVDVTQVLADAELAARQGRWVAGYVSYEAASAFD